MGQNTCISRTLIGGTQALWKVKSIMDNATEDVGDQKESEIQ